MKSGTLLAAVGMAGSESRSADARLRSVGEPARRSIRRDPPPRDPATIASDDPLTLRLAEELDYVRRILDHLGNTLATEPLVIARHGQDLQWFDVASQILAHVAAVTRSAFPDVAVERIGMSDLKARLQRRAIEQG